MDHPKADGKLIWTAWNSGSHSPTGVGYGFKIPIRDRDLYFDRAWKTVVVELPDGGVSKTVELNVEKSSFWGKYCHELLSKEFGLWLIKNRRGHWENRRPPRINVSILGEGKFRVEPGFVD